MSCGSIPLRSVHCVFSLLPSSTHRVQCTQQTTQCTLIIFCIKLQKPNSTPIIHAPKLRCSIHPIVVEIFQSQLVHRPTWLPLEPPLHTGLVSASSTDVLSLGIFIYHPMALPPRQPGFVFCQQPFPKLNQLAFVPKLKQAVVSHQPHVRKALWQEC